MTDDDAFALTEQVSYFVFKKEWGIDFSIQPCSLESVCLTSSLVCYERNMKWTTQYRVSGALFPV